MSAYQVRLNSDEKYRILSTNLYIGIPLIQTSDTITY